MVYELIQQERKKEMEAQKKERMDILQDKLLNIAVSLLEYSSEILTIKEEEDLEVMEQKFQDFSVSFVSFTEKNMSAPTFKKPNPSKKEYKVPEYEDAPSFEKMRRKKKGKE